jgi:predicted DCC family thiol-disulfide oxidoreductase YuxK
MTKTPAEISPELGDFLLYDGECPFCSAFVKMQRMRAAGINLKLLDAREHPELVSAFFRQGLDVNEGMIMRMGGAVYFGGDVMNMVALMTGPTGLFNRILAAGFSNRRVSLFLYPFLRTGRNAALALLGRKKIEQH